MSNLDHFIELNITKNNVLVFRKKYDDHISAKLSLIKQLYKIFSHSHISNIGEYTTKNYEELITNNKKDNINIDLPDSSKLKNNSEYCYGRFNVERILPDLLNNFHLMQKDIFTALSKEEIEYEITFVVIKK